MTDPVYEQIPMTQILEPSHRLRESIDAERLGELADSIAAEGLHQPIGVRGPLDGGRFEIVWGHRRFLACQLLKWDAIPARLFAADYDPLLAAVSENLNREQMTPLEEARAVARFVERGEPDAAIARLFRRSSAWVAGRRRLLDLAPELQEAIHEGRLSLGVAEVLGDIDHEDYRASLVKEAQRTGATRTTVEVWRQHYLADRERLIGNHSTVEEIAASREAWVIYTRCDGCAQNAPFADTRSMRFCASCYSSLVAALRDAENGAAAS
jgi:ParB family chromosome partitioning protein